MTTCALCLREEKLCNSHILPEAFYKNIYDSKHTYPVTCTSVNTGRVTRYQKGRYERLLCQSCEQLFSAWETHALAHLFQRTHERGVNHGQATAFKVDYAKFKLFQLSLLWRMGASRLVEFEGVRLDLKDSDMMRNMLLESKPGAPWQYACHLTYIAVANPGMSSIILSPLPGRADQYGIPVYVMAAGGLLWTYMLASEAPPDSEYYPSLLQDGTLWVHNEGSVPTAEYFSRFLGPEGFH